MCIYIGVDSKIKNNCRGKTALFSPISALGTYCVNKMTIHIIPGIHIYESVISGIQSRE